MRVNALQIAHTPSQRPLLRRHLLLPIPLRFRQGLLVNQPALQPPQHNFILWSREVDEAVAHQAVLWWRWGHDAVDI